MNAKTLIPVRINLVLCGALFLPCLGCRLGDFAGTAAAQAGTAGTHKEGKTMGSQATPVNPGMVPHPGTIVFRQMWNHTERTEPVSSVPEPNRFVYYDAQGAETSSRDEAVRRVPIVEVELSSFDADGKLVEPSKAVRFGIAEYGPDHKFLRHTSGR